MSEKIVQLNEAVIKSELKELVRGSVEETLNELLEAEAEKLTKRPGMSATSSARATAAATTTVILPPLLGISPSRYLSSREFLLKLQSLSGTVAMKAAWKRLSLRCTEQAYPSDVWRTSPRLCRATRYLPPPSVN